MATLFRKSQNIQISYALLLITLWSLFELQVNGEASLL